MRLGITVAALSALATSAFGIVVADPSQYVQRPDHAIVGKLGGGSCVPIGARYALTANHVGANLQSRIVIDGVYYHVKQIFVHPDAPTVDMKVLEIKGPPYFEDWVPIHPAPTTVPLHSIVYIGGTGYETGAPSGDCIAWGGRAEHWALNQVEGYFTSAVHYAWYRYDAGVPYEGMAALYDSGSPMLAVDPDLCRLYLMGIATSASTASGPTCDGHSAYYLLADDPWLQQFTGPVCAGDLDADGDTDLADFQVLLSVINGTAEDCNTRDRGDLNGDGRVDIGDFTVLSANFGCLP